MSDYSKLVKDLRDTERVCRDRMDGQVMLDAADAIEALQAYCEQLKTENTALFNTITPDRGTMLERIKRLEQQLPKRGEWIYEDLDNFRKYKVTCPHCGAWFVGNYDAYDEPSDFNYCPHCGNICNPANLDWENELKEREKEAMAKMEVQE